MCVCFLYMASKILMYVNSRFCMLEKYMHVCRGYYCLKSKYEYMTKKKDLSCERKLKMVTTSIKSFDLVCYGNYTNKTGNVICLFL